MAQKFSDEKILQILKESKAPGMTVAKLCKKYGFSEPSFYVWKKKYERNMGVEPQKSPYNEIQYLRRALGEALVENALLKQRLGI